MTALPLFVVCALLLLRNAASVQPTFMASIPDEQGHLMVWEDLSSASGDILFFREDNTTLVRRLSKRDEDAGQLVPPSELPCCGNYSLAELMAADSDLLGRWLMRTGEPDEAEVAAALPPFVALGCVAAFVGSRKGPAYGLTATGNPQVGSVGYDQIFKMWIHIHVCTHVCTRVCTQVGPPLELAWGGNRLPCRQQDLRKLHHFAQGRRHIGRARVLSPRAALDVQRVVTKRQLPSSRHDRGPSRDLGGDCFG